MHLDVFTWTLIILYSFSHTLSLSYSLSLSTIKFYTFYVSCAVHLVYNKYILLVDVGRPKCPVFFVVVTIHILIHILQSTEIPTKRNLN